jgi:hypothetical protein
MYKQSDTNLLKNKNKLRKFTDNPDYNENNYFKLCLINWFLAQKAEQKHKNEIKINLEPFFNWLDQMLAELLTHVKDGVKIRI